MRVFGAVGLTVLLASCSYFEKEKPPVIVAPPAPVFVPSVPEPVAKPMPKPEPEKPFNVFGAILGDACPRAKSMLADYATCSNGRIMAIQVEIPAFDAMAKARIFERAIAKYDTPTEDRRGGLPMRVKVMMPDWAAMKTQPDLRPYRDKRSAFWWVDEVARHFLSIEENETSVTIRVMLVDPKARLDFDKAQSAQQKLEAMGTTLTEKF